MKRRIWFRPRNYKETSLIMIMIVMYIIVALILIRLHHNTPIPSSSNIALSSFEPPPQFVPNAVYQNYTSDGPSSFKTYSIDQYHQQGYQSNNNNHLHEWFCRVNCRWPTGGWNARESSIILFGSSILNGYPSSGSSSMMMTLLILRSASASATAAAAGGNNTASICAIFEHAIANARTSFLWSAATNVWFWLSWPEREKDWRTLWVLI